MKKKMHKYLKRHLVQQEQPCCNINVKILKTNVPPTSDGFGGPVVPWSPIPKKKKKLG
jgi:hypothetical protein